MSADTKVLPVRKWVVKLAVGSDADLAREGWLNLIRAQGWSPVGEAEYVEQAEFGEAAVYGRVVEYPGLTVAAGLTAIAVPA